MSRRAFRGHLEARARRANCVMPPDLIVRLETYYSLLQVWNRTINLAGMTPADDNAMALDRLLIEPVLGARACPPGTRRVIDVGSGGGSPAIPLALALKTSFLTMVESKARKAAFLREALRVLELDGSVEVCRFEALARRPDIHESYDALTIRAVRLDADGVELLQTFVRPEGWLLWFHTSGQVVELAPPLIRHAVVPLVEALHSSLLVLQKQSRR
jgi:16S rRNA (guanine527-N7)-methyltransferase